VLKQYENQLAWINRTADKGQPAQQHEKQAVSKSAHKAFAAFRAKRKTNLS